MSGSARQARSWRAAWLAGQPPALAMRRQSGGGRGAAAAFWLLSLLLAAPAGAATLPAPTGQMASAASVPSPTPALTASEASTSPGQAMSQAVPLLAEGAAPEDMYLDAMRAIAEGRQQEASDTLSRMVRLEPQHAGAWLDLAIIQCELGHAAEAERLFAAIVDRFAPPPAILEVIASNRAKGCIGWQPSSKLALLLGRGADSNVNQGASSPFFTFGLGDNLVNAQLLPDYLPRRDQFTVFQADYSRDLAADGTVASVQFQARVNDRLARYDAAAVNLGLERPWRIGDWGLRGIGTLGLLSLDGRLYQTQAALQLRITPKLPLPDGLQLSVTPGVAHVDYPTLTSYNANTAELRSQLSYRFGTTEINAILGYQGDFSGSARPGGDRHGWSSGVRANTRLGARMFGELGWTRQTWQSDSMYAPGLIETVRHQDTQVLRGTLIMPVRPHQNVQLEVRDVRNQENISIFQYNSVQVQLSWQWLNF